MLRLWGRKYFEAGSTPAYEWVPVVTGPGGDNEAVYLTNLIQVLLLNRGESPFYANYGIPSQQSVIQQIAPDLFAQITAQQFAPFFAALQINRIPGAIDPSYNVAATLFSGRSLAFSVDGRKVVPI